MLNHFSDPISGIAWQEPAGPDRPTAVNYAGIVTLLFLGTAVADVRHRDHSAYISFPPKFGQPKDN
jgi:hypothetical protein